MVAPGQLGELIAEATPIVHFWAGKYWRRWRGEVDLNDLVQEGRIAVLRAAETFDAARGATFKTYAAKAIRHSLMKYLDSHRTAVRVPVGTTRDGEPLRLTCYSLDAPLSASDASSPSWLDMLTTSGADGACNLPAQVVEAIDALPPREREVLLAHHCDGNDFEDLGRRLGVTRQQAAHLEYRAIARLTTSLLGRRRDAEGKRLCESCGADISARAPAARFCKASCRQRAPVKRLRC